LQGAQIDYSPPEVEQADLLESEMPEKTPAGQGIDFESLPNDITAEPDKKPEPAVPEVSAVPQDNRTGSNLPGNGNVQIVGFIDETYILGIGADGLIIIDQHAAHERVMFERLVNAARRGVPSQQLLLPITLELSRAEAAYVDKNSEIFLQLGFEVESLSSNTVMLNAVPASLKQENAGGLLTDMLSELLEEGKTSNKLDVEALAMASCKAAVKAHDQLTLHEARSLFQQMAQCDLPFSCPHGRPTIVHITKKELEKRFGRK
jgi:DNA mismatch repair protein MutL